MVNDLFLDRTNELMGSGLYSMNQLNKRQIVSTFKSSTGLYNKRIRNRDCSKFDYLKIREKCTGVHRSSSV